MISLEREAVIGGIPDTEKRFLDLPPYRRDGLIPSWTDVVVSFKLDEFHPRDLRLVRGYYRAQRTLAEGRPTKAKRIFQSLDKNPDFKSLEENNDALLTRIASYVRKPTEDKKR